MSHLKRIVKIHAPLETVYNTVHDLHDPKHWADWYVGVSDEVEMKVEGRAGQHRLLMVGTPFPLTQRVLEDNLGEDEAHWKARAVGPARTVEVTRPCRLVMLSGETDWTYRAIDDDTEVTVVRDFTVPTEMLETEDDRTVIERIEAQCLEQSLENLRQLCEVSH
jgi:uncharacterized membrane protein